LARLPAFFDGFDEMLVGAEAVFTVDGVFEEESFERLEGEGHVAAEEDEEAKAGEVLEEVGNVREVEEAIKGKLAEDDGDIKEADVDSEDGFFGEKTVKVEDGGDGNGDDEETDEFGEEIVRV